MHNAYFVSPVLCPGEGDTDAVVRLDEAGPALRVGANEGQDDEVAFLVSKKR